MQWAFKAMFKVKQLDVSNWNTSKVTNTSYMFDSCTSLTEIKVDNWDMSHVTNMQNMFYHIEGVKTLNLSKWNPESCENTSYMFSNDYNLTSIGNTSNWDVSKVKEIRPLKLKDIVTVP